MLLKACLNGHRPSSAHAALPITPQAIAQTASDVIEAGADALHIHPRGADGLETLAPDVIAETLDAVRARCPGIPVGVSTGAWIEPDPARRIALVQSWGLKPDFAGVNFAEEGAVTLCHVLLSLGIGVEAGLATPGDAQLLVASGLAVRCVRLLIEPNHIPTVPEGLAVAQAIECLLDTHAIPTPRLLHGMNSTAWPLLDYALTRGYAIRIGFEDTLTLPDGAPARDNAELVRAAWRRMQ